MNNGAIMIYLIEYNKPDDSYKFSCACDYELAEEETQRLKDKKCFNIRIKPYFLKVHLK